MHAATCFLLLTSVAFAAEEKSSPLIYSLPADGAWATFEATVDTDGQSVPLTWTVRSVGRVMHEGKACRCVEMEQTCEGGPHQIIIYVLGNTTWRMIIPEEEFGAGKDPLAKAVKVWQQLDKAEPRLQPSIAAADPLFAAILKGPPGELTREKNKEKIQWQKGALDCDVLAGSQEIDFAGAKLNLGGRILRHRDVPFETAGIRQELNASVGGADYQVRIKATLRDYGKDAKPKFPQLVP